MGSGEPEKAGNVVESPFSATFPRENATEKPGNVATWREDATSAGIMEAGNAPRESLPLAPKADYSSRKTIWLDVRR